MKRYIFLMVVLFLCGCSVNTHLTVDVLNPAKRPVLQKAADVALITDVFNPEKCGQFYFYDKRSIFDSTCRVRFQAEVFMEGIQDIIGDSQFFMDVANIGLSEKNMPFSDMLSLSQDADPEILLILNAFKMQDREFILEHLAYEAGKKVASYFFPAWVSVTRMVIVPSGNEWQRASEAALAGSWERADFFWEALSKEKSKKKQSAAWFNRAVYQEINGDFETAADYVRRADALCHRKIHRTYLNVWEQRMLMEQQFDALILND